MHINQNCFKLLKKKKTTQKQGREEGETRRETMTRRKTAGFFFKCIFSLGVPMILFDCRKI